MRDNRIETGESTAKMNQRADMESWERFIRPYMKKGAFLIYQPKTKMYYTQIGDEFGRYGISPTAVRNLEKAGELTLVGAQKYSLSERAAA